MKALQLTLFILSGQIISLEQTSLSQNKNSLSFSDVDFANALTTNENVLAEPKIITQRFAAEPKIITERTIGKPKIVSESYVEPFRQRIVIAPTINQKIESLLPDYRQEMDKFSTNSTVLPTKTTVQQQPKLFSIDGDKIYHQTIIEPKVNKITEQLNVIEGGENSQALDPIFKPAQVQNLFNKIQVPVPANKIVNQPIIQPIFEKENLKVSFAQGKDSVIDNEPIQRQVVIQQKLREETIQKPGDVYFRQDIIKPFINKEHLIVNFDEPEPNFKTNEKIELKPIENNNLYQLQQNLPIPVEDQRLVATPATIGYDIPVNHYQYLPIYSQGCVPCCGCAPKPSQEDLQYQNLQKQRWNEVLNKFSTLYGRDTFDSSLLSIPVDTRQIIKNNEIPILLGGYSNNQFVPKHFKQNEDDLKDPQGWDWVQVPYQWKVKEAGEGKWNPSKGRLDQRVYEPKMKSYSDFHH